MPTINLVLAGIHIQLVTHNAVLTELFLDYFSYYSPKIDDQTIENGRLRLEMICPPRFPTLAEWLPPTARLISETGVLRMWDDPACPSGSWYFHTEVAAFRVDIATSVTTGLVSPHAFDYPHILANTYAMFPLLLMLRSRGCYHLHAAGVVSPRGRLWLISGSQRSGKTTLTTALGLAGWKPISDDSLLMTIDDGAPRIVALRKYFHLGDALLDSWPALGAIERRHHYLDRTCVAALQFFGASILAEEQYLSVDHLLLPRISGESSSRIDEISPGNALLTLGEQSVYLQVWRDHTIRQWQGLEKIVRGASSFRLQSGIDLLADPLLASRLLGQLETSFPSNQSERPVLADKPDPNHTD
jgi:hypothetical protein